MPSEPTLFLSRSDTVKLLDPRSLVDLLANAFIEYSYLAKRHEFGFSAPLNFGRLAASGLGLTSAISAYSVKLDAKCLPSKGSSSGLLHLYDRESGRLLALLESSHLSSVGSALSSALATDLIAPPEATRVAVIGTGVQGWMVIRFLMEMRKLSEIALFDLVRRRSLRAAGRLSKYKELKVMVADGLTDAVAGAEIILCATHSRIPFLFPEMVLPGGHVTALGSDEPGKREVASELLSYSAFFTDDRLLARSRGALLELKARDDLVVLELGELLGGVSRPRLAEDGISVYAPVGLPVQDLVVAWSIYEQARLKGAGHNVYLLGDR